MHIHGDTETGFGPAPCGNGAVSTRPRETYYPASEIELPRAEKRLPKHVLTADEAERVMEKPKLADPIGLRDRAILETLYSTGIRRMEVIHLQVFDLDVERGTVMVRQGKWKKDRMVPIGERAIVWIEKYLNEARPQLVMPPDAGVLFLTQEGDELSPHRLTQLARDYVNAAEIGKSGRAICGVTRARR